MDVSAEKDEEVWVNKAFGVPSFPECRRAYYPFSKGPALTYRLKLALVLLYAAGALYHTGDDPCLRLCLLHSFWLLYITYDYIYRNYPWREPLYVWLWWFRWSVPHSEAIATICVLLFLLTSAHVGLGCELQHPLADATVLWLSGMVAWPLIRERWHRGERTDDDYDQFSAIRPWVLTLPRPLALAFAALRSPSLLALLASCTAAWIAGLLLPGCISDVWAVFSAFLVLGSLAVLCCHRLPRDVGRTLVEWEADEAAYARRIENTLRIVKGNLRTSGLPLEGSTRFDRLSVQVPLLRREVKILLHASRTLSDGRARDMEELTAARELTEFGEMLDHYGPYTTDCCIS